KQHLNTISHWNFVLALTLTTTAYPLATSFINTLVTEHRRTELWMPTRLLSTFSDPDFQAQGLPLVSIIERFSVDRQHYRSFSVEFLAKMVSSLRYIKYFGYMYWPALGRNEWWTDEAARESILRAVMDNPRIQTLTVWNALIETFPLDLSQYRLLSYSLISAALEASYRRERVALPNVIDAIDFFASTSKLHLLVPRKTVQNTHVVGRALIIWP
ncbi:uncharacterized protein CCOS01_10092, partial [Colletotrichum costaricense]